MESIVQLVVKSCDAKGCDSKSNDKHNALDLWRKVFHSTNTGTVSIALKVNPSCPTDRRIAYDACCLDHAFEIAKSLLYKAAAW